MTDSVISDEYLKRVSTERSISAGFLALVFIMAVADIATDIYEGEPPVHMIIEGACILIALAGASFLWNEARKLRRATQTLTIAVVKAHKDTSYWRKEANEALRGLGEAIDKQFARWALSEAEREVGLLLLKGLSMKEVSDIRNTSEKTVRHQAASLYRKAGIEGRAQLSAFFLEDLLLPR